MYDKRSAIGSDHLIGVQMNEEQMTEEYKDQEAERLLERLYEGTDCINYRDISERTQMWYKRTSEAFNNLPESITGRQVFEDYDYQLSCLLNTLRLEIMERDAKLARFEMDLDTLKVQLEAVREDLDDAVDGLDDDVRMTD